MSRFDSGDDEMPEDEVLKFEGDLQDAYMLVTADLQGFLAHLDAMPVKRIIASRFMDPKTMEACSIGEYCRYKGMTKLQLLKAEGESYYERLEGGDYERNDDGSPVGPEQYGGWEGATTAAGMNAGLPHLVAYNLAYTNDEIWENVQEKDSVPCDERCELVDGNWGMKVPRERRWGSCRTGHIVYRPMTPEERWQKLRNHVAREVEMAGAV